AGSVVVSCAHLVDTPLARNLVGRRPMVRVEHKGRGVNHSINMEIKIEQVSADRRRDCSESDRWSGCALAVLGTLAFGMDVQVGDMSFAERDEVPERTEIRLQRRDGLPISGDGNGQLARRAGNQITLELEGE